jgi:hypothetical protein
MLSLLRLLSGNYLDTYRVPTRLKCLSALEQTCLCRLSLMPRSTESSIWHK